MEFSKTNMQKKYSVAIGLAAFEREKPIDKKDIW